MESSDPKLNRNYNEIEANIVETSKNRQGTSVLSCENSINPSVPALIGAETKFGRSASNSLIAILIVFLIFVLVAASFILHYMVVRSVAVLLLVDANLTDFYRYNNNGSDLPYSMINITGDNEKKLFAHSIYGADALPNLTALCLRSKGQCWFHPAVYPYSCSSTFCESVEFEVSLNESTSKIQFSPVVSLHRLDSIPDRTPCARDSWCISGRCEPVDQANAEIKSAFKRFQIKSKKPVKGGWSIDCDKPRCLVNKFVSKIHWKLLQMAAKCPGIPCSAYVKDLLRLIFRSCTNPLPAYGGKACGDPDGPWPVIWGSLCQVNSDCPRLYGGEEARKTIPTEILSALCGGDGHFIDHHSCACRTNTGTVLRVEDGAPCWVTNQTSLSTAPVAGRCLFGACVDSSTNREALKTCSSA